MNKKFEINRTKIKEEKWYPTILRVICLYSHLNTQLLTYTLNLEQCGATPRQFMLDFLSFFHCCKPRQQQCEISFAI